MGDAREELLFQSIQLMEASRHPVELFDEEVKFIAPAVLNRYLVVQPASGHLRRSFDEPRDRARKTPADPKRRKDTDDERAERGPKESPEHVPKRSVDLRLRSFLVEPDADCARRSGV